MTPDAWRRAQLLVRGFYDQLDSDVDLIDIHREAVAMAAVERENTLALFGHIANVAASSAQGPDKQKLVRLLEEVWFPGLREQRERQSRQENEELLRLAKKTFRVEQRGQHLVGNWENTDKNT